MPLIIVSDVRSESAAFGVGQIFACTVSDVGCVRGPDVMFAFAARFDSGVPQMSRASGVPHIAERTVASVNVTPCEPVVFGLPPDDLLSIPVGVGHEPEASSSMWCTNGGRGVQSPFRIEPELGKVVEDFG